MNEHAFWSKVRLRLPEGHYSRIENPADPGTPDVSFCVRGVEGFLELKYRPRPPLQGPLLGDRYGLLPSQVLWLRNRLRAGGRVAALVGVSQDIYLVPGPLVLELNTLPREAFPEPGDLNSLAQLVHHWLKRRVRQ